MNVSSTMHPEPIQRAENGNAATHTPGVLYVVFQTGHQADGGTESVTQIIEHLVGYRTDVLTTEETDKNRRWRQAGATVTLLSNVSLLNPPRTAAGKLLRPLRVGCDVIRCNGRAARLIKQRRPDVVHVNDIGAFVHTFLAARWRRVPIVFNVRNVHQPDDRYGLQWKLARSACRVIVVLSNEMRAAIDRRVSGLFGRRCDVRTIYSGVDLQRMTPLAGPQRARLRQQLGIAEDEFAIGYVAAFTPRKNQLQVIDQLGPRLTHRLGRARIHFVGDHDPEKNEYARACAGRAADPQLRGNVLFHGFSTDVARWYQALDVVLVASTREGLARCMIESLACGTPVVSFDVCSAREILEGHRCGLVAPHGDYDLMCDQLCQLADGGELWCEFSRSGAATARKLFDARQNHLHYEQLYRTIAAGDELSA